MRVALVGSPDARARLRGQLPASIEVAAEYHTVADATRAGPDVEALIVAPARGSSLGATASRKARRHSLQRGARRGSGAWPDREQAEPEIAVEPLTSREMDVLSLLALGLPNKAIAERLGISDQTVKFHVASISGKLGAINRTDAVRRAVRRGLLTL